MKAYRKILFVLVLVLSLCLIVSCDKGNNNDKKEDDLVDYVSQVKLERSFQNKSFVTDGIEEVTLLQAVDGDTIHVTDHRGAILKLRFLGVDTPESTSQVEPWGAAASAFTKKAVRTCVSLVITGGATDGKAELDTYGRHLSWVWYKPSENEDYKLLNLELAQLGYSKAKYSDVNQYKEELRGAITQAMKQKIKVWGETDPDYCYTEALEVSLPTLKQSLNEKGKESEYYNKKVIFTATVAKTNGQTYYLMDTDLESGITYAIQVFHRTSTGILDVVGTRVKISGTITYYETGDVYQLTDVIDRRLSSNKNNLKVVEENLEVTPRLITIDDIDNTNGLLEFTLVQLNNLVVKRTYTTNTEGSSSNGAISIYCEVDGKEITVRTVVMVDKDNKYLTDKNNIVLDTNFKDKTIDVIGVLEKYEGKYQIKLISMDDVTIR